jgi:hypothetical protein
MIFLLNVIRFLHSMGLITFKLKTGAQISINTTNIVSIERRDNYVVILYNVAFNRGLFRCMKGRLHSDKYEYKSSDEAIEAFNIMCQSFKSNVQEQC